MERGLGVAGSWAAAGGVRTDHLQLGGPVDSRVRRRACSGAYPEMYVSLERVSLHLLKQAPICGDAWWSALLGASNTTNSCRLEGLVRGWPKYKSAFKWLRILPALNSLRLILPTTADQHPHYTQPITHRRNKMASSLESPTFRWKHDLWVTTPRPDSIDKSTVADVLDDRHQAVFQRAMTNVLATDLAELTFAQLVDGLPLLEFAIDMSRHSHTREEPVCKHTELCPGAMDQARALRQIFNPLTMEIRSDVSFTPLGTLTPELILSDTQFKVLNRYQSVPVGSKASKLPLIELIAVAIHALAV